MKIDSMLKLIMTVISEQHAIQIENISQECPN